MNNYYVLAVKKPYLDAIIDGSKKYEIRTRIPRNLSKGDWLFLVESGSGGKIQAAAKVDRVRFVPADVFYEEHAPELCITREDYYDYTLRHGHKDIYAISFSQVTDARSRRDYLIKLGLNRTPQWFQRVDMMTLVTRNARPK